MKVNFNDQWLKMTRISILRRWKATEAVAYRSGPALNGSALFADGLLPWKRTVIGSFSKCEVLWAANSRPRNGRRITNWLKLEKSHFKKFEEVMSRWQLKDDVDDPIAYTWFDDTNTERYMNDPRLERIVRSSTDVIVDFVKQGFICQYPSATKSPLLIDSIVKAKSWCWFDSCNVRWERCKKNKQTAASFENKRFSPLGC